MPVSYKQLTVFAPAKVNLHLAIQERRCDGFHSLESIFLKVDFGDTLHFLPVNDKNSKKNCIEFTGNTETNIPPEENTIFNALSMFRSRTDFDKGLIIKVEKRIPSGGGLGGGSSDAASTLLALNQIANFPLNRSDLLEMAAVLGSDVPFFIYETGAAWVTGRGECVKPLQTTDWFLVLVNPGFPSGTASAFRLLDNYRLKNASRGRIAFQPSHLCNMNFADMYNDFLPVFPEPEKSVYNSIIVQLRELGADFASLSGSGSTCFGIFNTKTQAENADVVLSKKWKFVKSCRTGIN